MIAPPSSPMMKILASGHPTSLIVSRTATGCYRARVLSRDGSKWHAVEAGSPDAAVRALQEMVDT